MTIHTIRTPEPDHSGLVGRVMVHNGTAEVDSEQYPEELRYMASAGYQIDPPYSVDDKPAGAEAGEPADDSSKPTRPRRGAKSEGEQAA